MTVHGFWLAQDAMAGAGETASQALMRQVQRRYVACWAKRKDPGGRGAAGSWVPLPFERCAARLLDWVCHLHCCRHDGRSGGWLARCCSRSSIC
jgi:hypothetical protein